MCFSTWFEERKVPSPDVVGTIGAADLQTLLKSELGDIPILIPDHHFILATKDSFESFLEYDNTDCYKYTGDNPSGGFDCDDYACVLHGNVSIPKWANIPIGTIWLSKPAHAVNIFVDENLDVYYLEPQNDKLMLVKNKIDWVPYICWL